MRVMKIILILVSMLFALNSNYAFAKDMYFNCGSDGHDWKYSKSFFGSGKMYNDKGGEWIEEKDTKITDDRIRVDGWSYLGKKCNPKCKIRFVFDLVYDVRGTGKYKYTTQKEYAVNDCKLFKYGSCQSYAAGNEIESRNCSVKIR